jgi:superfamily II DNA/RNA helicase
LDFIAGTVGRIKDHLQKENINLTSLRTIVIDEADQMLSMGFKQEVEFIIETIKTQAPKLQICLFSATMPDWVNEIAEKHMQPDLIKIDMTINSTHRANKNINHMMLEVRYDQMVKTINPLLQMYSGIDGKAIVFTKTKREADEIAAHPDLKNCIEVMHGDCEQYQREATIQRLREGKMRWLVATDVAARGIDIQNVELIIQTEPPRDADTYIHRSGRTARAGKFGSCITMFTSRSRQNIEDI